jgi:uncharacterized membrane protein YfcA
MVSADILTVMLGTVAGILGGALGQSGAEVILPGLLILGIVPDFKTAAGTVLLTILPPLSLLAILEYYKRGQLNVRVAIILMIVYFFAAYIGAHFTKNVSDKTLEYTASIYFFVIGAFFMWNAYTGFFGSKTASNSSKPKNKEIAGFTTIRHILKNFPNLQLF